MRHWTIDSKDDSALSTYVEDIEMNNFLVAKSDSRTRLIS